MQKEKDQIQILSLHENWPHPASPAAWVHAAEQLKAVARFCRVTAIITPLESVSLRHGNLQAEAGIPRYIQEDGFSVYWPPYWSIPRHSYSLDDYSKALSVTYTILRKQISFQLLHAHYVYRTGFVGALVARWLRKPLIITAHGTDVWRLMHEADLPTQIRTRSMTALTVANCILAVSQDIESMLDELGFEDKTEVICMGVPSHLFVVQDKAVCRKRLGLPVDQHLLLYVGHLYEVKGADLLPSVLNYVFRTRQDVNLVIVGQGYLRTSMESEFQRLGLGAKVRFAGEIPYIEIPNYIGAADMLLMPSRQEGRPVAAMEALACGRPVIASCVGGLPEIVADDDLGLLVEPEDPVAFAAAINQALRRGWDSETLHQWAQQFDWDNLVPQIVGVYRNVLARKKGGFSGEN